MNESAAFKNTGNQLYKEGKYEAALEKYQQAIVLSTNILGSLQIRH